MFDVDVCTEWCFRGARKSWLVLLRFFFMFFFWNDSSFCSCRRSSTAASFSSWALLNRRPKTSSPGCSGREAVSSWAASPSPTATLRRRWARPPTTPRRAPTRLCARSTSSLTRGDVTGQKWWDGGRCGRLRPRGSLTASQPSASSLCRTLKLWTKWFHPFQNYSYNNEHKWRKKNQRCDSTMRQLNTDLHYLFSHFKSV